MPRRARIHFVSLHSSLVNLPISLYGPLLERGIRPQGLAVHLTRSSAQNAASNNGRVEVYVGWTGMASASSLAHFNSADTSDRGLETVEIDPQYAEGLGLALGDVVEIGLLHDLGYATSVATEPVTSDDWEIIEIHASHVEGTLLSQVRVAVIGQEIDVWVLGRTRVRLKVVSLEPSSAGKALLLTTSTEVSIAPKPHNKGQANGSRGTRANAKTHNKLDKRNGVNGHARAQQPDTEPASATDEGRKKRATVMRVLPRRVLGTSPWGADPPQTESELASAYVSRTTLLSLSDNPDASTSIRSWRASVRKMKPPSDPAQDHPAAAPSAPPVPRVLIPNGDAANSQATAVPPKNEVVVKWSPDVKVPTGHVILESMIDGVDDWDLVNVTFIRDLDLLSDPPEQLTEQDVELNNGRRRMPMSQHGLAGVDDIVSKCTRFCLTNFALHAFSGRVRGVPGLLVTGRSGAGKTSLLHAVGKSMQEDSRTFAYTLYVDLAKFTEAPIAKIRSLFNYWMDKGAWHRPSLLMLDNMDKLMNAEVEHADSFRSRHITELFIDIFGTSSRSAAPNANGVVLLAAAESQAALHSSINSSHVFREVVVLKPPGKDARRDIIAQLVRDRTDTPNVIQDPSAPLNFTALATQTEGYSVTDLKDFVARAVHKAAIRNSVSDDSNDIPITLIPDDFASAKIDFIPLSLRDVKLQKSDVEWADIGGLKETKRILRETLEWPTKYAPIFAQSPLRLRSGLLLYGYPGCGKTLLASAVAKECGLNFISIKGPELLNKYIGASEKSVRDIFERASAAKPCILFFDEFDSIAPKRGHDSTGVTDRVVNQMLTQMDGAEGLDGVYVLAATSRPDLIDSALLRPGRLDKSLLCGMPDTEERKEILVSLSRKISIAASADLDYLAQETEGFSGADLQALVYNAHLEVIHNAISSRTGDTPKPTQNGDTHTSTEDGVPMVEYTVLGESNPEHKKVLSKAEESAFRQRIQRMLSKPSSQRRVGHGETVASTSKHEITEEHLRKVLTTTRPSVSREERARLSRIYRAFVSDRSGELPVPPEGTEVGSRVSLM